ncbi:APC family permease [Vallicoccus soli]|uniref:Amino acid permease n=1 Tax=Vallicoccus soli TaxID=2339232 RepID=A0A3A3YZ42_9ACTN|nr:amino acid permease [Vallicoccus soli]
MGATSAGARQRGTDEGGTPLRRAISGRLLYLFILGDVLGAGVYALAGEVAAETGGAVWVPLLVALLLALLTAASYAELVTKYPRAGGAAVFAQRAYGRPLVSFLVGFCMLAAGVTSVAGLALAFGGDYLGAFVDLPPVPVALVFLLAVGLLNARGIKDSLAANAVMTVVEVTGLVVVVVLGAMVVAGGDGDVGRVTEFREGTSAGGAVLAGAVLAFYSFVGFETSANVAEETQDPRRAFPRALFLGLGTAGLLYVLVGLAASAAVPTDELAGSTGPLLQVVEAAGTGLPPEVFSAVALVAVANGALLTSIMASRLAYGMAVEGLLPRPLARVLPGRRTPGVAIAATLAVSMALALTGDLAELAATVVLLLLVVFISTNVAVLVLRRQPVDHDHFRTPTALPVLGVASCVLLLFQQEGGVWLRAGLLLLAGLALYGLQRALGGGRAAAGRGAA